MKQLREFIITTLIGGVVVLLPIVILIWVAQLLVALIESLLRPITNLINLEVPDIVINLIAIAAVIAFCFIVGLAIRTRSGSMIFNYVEKQWFERLPVYSSIRDIVQQFTGKKKQPFNQVVILEAFGTKMTGFVTDEDGDDFTIFVPTAPNPTNGFVFHARRDQIVFVEAKTEAAMRTVVGMGVGSQALMKSNIVETPEAERPLEG